MTGTGEPSPDDASGDARRRFGHRSVLLAVIALVVVVAIISDGSDPPSLTHGTTLDPIASELVHPAAVASDTAPDLEVALIGLDDLPAGWMPAGRKLGRMHPDEGFCGRAVPADTLLDIVSAAFALGPEGPWVVSAVQTHTSPEAADAYLDAKAATTACAHWVDSSGVGQRVETRAVTAPVGAERAVGFVQLSQSATSTFRAEITYLRHGRALGLVAVIHAGADADRERDPAIARLPQSMAERLPAAAR